MTHHVRWAAGAALVCALAIGGAVPLEAQRMSPGGNPNRTELERRVQARFAEMIKQRLGLSEADAARLGQTMDSFVAQRRQLHMEEQAVRSRLEALLQEPSATDSEALVLLQSMEDMRARETRLLHAEQEALLRVLTPLQLVRLHGMRAQLGERIQQLRGGQGPMGGGPAGPPWRRPPGGGPEGDGGFGG